MKFFNSVLTLMVKNPAHVITTLVTGLTCFSAIYVLIVSQKNEENHEEKTLIEELQILDLVVNQPLPSLYTVIVRDEKHEIKTLSAKEFVNSWRKKKGYYTNSTVEVFEISYSIFDDSKPGESYVRLRAKGMEILAEFHIERLPTSR